MILAFPESSIVVATARENRISLHLPGIKYPLLSGLMGALTFLLVLHHHVEARFDLFV